MKCPYCDHPDTRVIDSRPTEEGHAIRRRRGCDSCGKRFTTYEKIEVPMFMVVKKDARREVFDRNKVLNGIVKACEKRPVSMDQMEAMVSEIEKQLSNRMEKEVDSTYIGLSAVYRREYLYQGNRKTHRKAGAINDNKENLSNRH